ncbi:Panacea domain-containing protein [Streptococcus catagoni]|uniref:Panacea domain-containing protein n=1 Tax=Streptococcus catagoni TaxID=2654874 RepID=UPI0014093F83|nr:type II toxin-antitoxin system antitoxin SocA domain-containing protein [Streptococcus catagoni]
MITALDVANTFLVRAKKENIDISPMKLQKLVFLLYKEYLKNTEKKLFEDKFEVWMYGPVVSNIYQAFKKYGSNKITNYYINSNNQYLTVKFGLNEAFDNCFEKVWQKYKELDGVFLSQLTHQKDTAWSIADSLNREFLSDQDIYNEKEYEFGRSN